jgi:hypothetical protein
MFFNAVDLYLFLTVLSFNKSASSFENIQNKPSFFKNSVTYFKYTSASSVFLVRALIFRVQSKLIV